MKTVLVVAAALLSGSAFAQTSTVGANPATLVHADSGVVTVQGTPVSDSAGARAGDVIDANGEATITFANGCAVKVKGRYTVPAQAPACANGTVPAANDTKFVAAGIGAVVAVGLAVGSGGGGGSDQPSSP